MQSGGRCVLAASGCVRPLCVVRAPWRPLDPPNHNLRTQKTQFANLVFAVAFLARDLLNRRSTFSEPVSVSTFVPRDRDCVM